MNRKAIVGAALALVVSGCFNSQEVVATRAAREFKCPAGQVVTEDLGGNAIRVWACGFQATYVCSPRLGACIKESGGGGAATPAGGQQPGQRPGPNAPTYMPPSAPPATFPGAGSPGQAPPPASWPGGTQLQGY